MHLIENILIFHVQTIVQADLPAITSPLYELNAIGNRFGVKLSKVQFLDAIAQSCRLFDNSAAGDIITRAGEFLRDIFVKTLQATFVDYERQESALARLLLLFDKRLIVPALPLGLGQPLRDVVPLLAAPERMVPHLSRLRDTL